MRWAASRWHPRSCPDGTKRFELTAAITDWEIEPGVIVKAWTYNGVVPAPEISVDVGDKVQIVLTNNLPTATSIHYHGVRVPNAMDGVPPYTQDSIAPGAVYTYEFEAWSRRSGSTTRTAVPSRCWTACSERS